MPTSSTRAPNLDPATVPSPVGREQLIKLTTWCDLTFAPEDAPALATLQSWARNRLFSPPAIKVGRSYYVTRTAKYVGS